MKWHMWYETSVQKQYLTNIYIRALLLLLTPGNPHSTSFLYEKAYSMGNTTNDTLSNPYPTSFPVKEGLFNKVTVL